MKLTEHLYYYPGERRNPPFWGNSTSNSFIIKGESLALIDPGASVGPHMRNVRLAMKRDGLRWNDIKKIVLTHAHIDHAGGAARAARELKAPVFAHSLEIPMLQNPSIFWKEELDEASPALKELLPIPKWALDSVFFIAGGPHPPCPDVSPLREGDDLGLGIPATVINLPGHRAGEIGVHLPDDDALVIGDLINTYRGDLPSLNLPTSDLDAAEDSVRKIKNLNPEIIATAHEPPVKGRDRIQRWLDAILAQCDAMRHIAKRETRGNRPASLTDLGRRLNTAPKFVPFYEDACLAFVVLKSIGYSFRK